MGEHNLQGLFLEAFTSCYLYPHQLRVDMVSSQYTWPQTSRSLRMDARRTSSRWNDVETNSKQRMLSASCASVNGVACSATKMPMTSLPSKSGTPM
mmetsp:Transcript_65918/g.143900  ORF Transcript_65918/g.143900 Transcript_65918/m.143900 type:complete len:96 (-) Transcript_65918:339-626(-)